MNQLLVSLSIILLFPLLLVSAEDNPAAAPSRNPDSLLGAYPSGRIVSGDYKRIEAADIRIYRDYTVFINKKTRDEQILQLDQVFMIKAKVGTFWIEGTLIGAAGGLVLPLAAVNDKSRLTGEGLLISSVIGAGVGCLIGLLIDNYDTIYQSGTLFLPIAFTNTPATTNTLFPGRTIFNINIPLN